MEPIAAVTNSTAVGAIGGRAGAGETSRSMPDDIDMDHLRDWIGKQDRDVDTITPQLLKRFKATFGGYLTPDAPLPQGIHWCLALPAVTRDNLGVDGHPAKGGFLPPVPLPRRMWASSRMRFHKPPGIGVPIERTSTIADIVLKQSAASGPLVFVHIDHAFTQKTARNNETLIQDRQTIVYRQAAAFKPAQPESSQPQNSARLLDITPDSTLLFRYSALTFNSHRIHYDRDYVREKGYPGLLVQGTLIARLMLDIMKTERPDFAVSEFTFRSGRPVYDNGDFVIAGAPDEDGILLWATDCDGMIGMTARARGTIG